MTNQTPIELPSANEPVWRYLSFGRFVWLLQKKALWLSRGDLLGDDEWEGALQPRQLTALFDRVLPTEIGPNARFKTEGHALLDLIASAPSFPRSFYASCWARGEHESHALWSIYCKSKEGVAIRTTFGALQKSLPDYVEVLPVTYRPDEENLSSLSEIFCQKRPMFSYEREARVLWFDDKDVATAATNPPCRTISWDPSHIHEIRIHPKANDSFFETVTDLVKGFAPELAGLVQRSHMAAKPISAFWQLVARVTPSAPKN